MLFNPLLILFFRHDIDYNVENKFNIIPDFAAWVINRSELPDWIDYWWEKETNNE